MTREKVEEYCRLKIEGSDLGKLCKRLLHITFDKEIEGCMEDVKVRLAVSYTQTCIYACLRGILCQINQEFT